MRKKKSKASGPSRVLGWPLPAGLPPLFNARIRNGPRSLSLSLEPAATMSARLRGLMFRKKPAALLFAFDWTDRHSIHSFFVAFPFDAIYLDERGAIVEVFGSVPPFTPLLIPRAPARYLLELASGDAAKLGARIGDRLDIYRR
ncbi:MAG: DUF192 domain-containing protein [Candidatus Marsarchaeota archaeon]|nr:DUF192 domain-containing protein [Candidatus Marsarchaeota archaeon]